MSERNLPTRKKIVNFLSKLDIKRLEIKNERELELVVWGLLCGRWNEFIQYRKVFGGRTADISLNNIPIEIKYITKISEKDRCVGQVLDYINEANECVVIAIDPKEYLKNSNIQKINNVSVILL
ncbi:MAG: hypothetical protein DRI44_02685 [Chlamydiae bacterium]|nr:MAG: hypothetical protein DRI44_02685 [Chlamydiota bacterium]